MKILILNAGSSSIKFQVIDVRSSRALAMGLVEKIGEAAGRVALKLSDASGKWTAHSDTAETIADHHAGLERVIGALKASGILSDTRDLFAIGHRVVHGGTRFHDPTRIDAKILAEIRALIPLAPLHNEPNALGIEVALALCPNVPQVAVFDTAFHATLPPQAFHYALPREFFETHHVRRYGFHGTSHHYVAKRAAAILGRDLKTLNLITLHLGNGASATAIQNGASIDTSMGLTPLEGLVMGTRSGDIDPAIPFYLTRVAGKSSAELEHLLNEQSGLKGICGSNDMREVLSRAAGGDGDAQLALEMYAYRIKKYIGAYTAALGRVDALVFTAGIGENSALVRAKCCEGLSALGIVIDSDKNASPSHTEREIGAKDAGVRVLVIPTDEEHEIAEQTRRCIEHAGT